MTSSAQIGHRLMIRVHEIGPVYRGTEGFISDKNISVETLVLGVPKDIESNAIRTHWQHG